MTHSWAIEFIDSASGARYFRVYGSYVSRFVLRFVQCTSMKTSGPGDAVYRVVNAAAS